MEKVSRTSCFSTFPESEVRLTGLQFPTSFFLPFLKIEVTLAVLIEDDREQLASDLSQLLQHMWMHSNQAMDLCALILTQCSLTISCLTKGKSSLPLTLSLNSRVWDS